MDTKLKLPLQETLGNFHTREYGTLTTIRDSQHSTLCAFMPSCPYPFEYAQQIIKAVNSFDDMLELLKACREDARMALAEEWDRGDEGFQAQINAIDTLIRKVEGK